MSSRGAALGLAAILPLVAAWPVGAKALKTDLRKALVPPEEIIAGGPPPDGIPAIDRPVFVKPGAADAWLTPKEPGSPWT